MMLIGQWLSTRIEDGAIQNAALGTALFVESFVGPKLQGMAQEARSQPEIQQELLRLMRETPLGQRVYSFKVWAGGGRIVYAGDPDLIGRTFPPAQKQSEAWLGEVAAEFDSLHDAEDALERKSGKALLEIYVPIRKTYTEEVIAVAEFYEEAGRLKSEIHQAKLESWLMLGGVGLLAVVALYGMIARASRIISQQRTALEGRVQELSTLLDQNRSLRRHLSDASLRAAEVNERFLRRLGSELHDGPAQLISLALLRLQTDARAPVTSAQPRRESGTPQPPDDSTIRGALSDALAEIRNLSLGLSLPDLEPLSLRETIEDAVHTHERRSGTRVRVNMADLPDETRHITKATCYRFVQEALNNATRHANGKGLAIRAGMQGSTLSIEVRDSGPGFDGGTLETSGRLGLLGLRERLESIGGALVIASRPGQGTRLTASMPVSSEGRRHD